jgi:Carboxypeptidase regulatory-like domain
VRNAGPDSRDYYPGWVSALVLTLGVLALMFADGCRRGMPEVDPGSKPPAARGTITGIVRGPEGTSPMSGRTVEVVNTATGERRTIYTADNGGLTIELPAGKYRLELPLRAGETLLKRPGIVNLDRGNIDSQIEFVLGPARVARPRAPAYRLDNGLGSPIA